MNPLRLLVLPLIVLAASASVASAVGLCVGTGELCVKATATAPGTTNADTVAFSYGVSSTTLNAGEEGSHACGALVQTRPWTQAGAGCASESTAVWLHHSQVSGVSPGLCVGATASGAPLPCVAPGVSGPCAGVWWANEGSSGLIAQSGACTAADYFGLCAIESSVANVGLCGGADAYGAPCPNGDAGTQFSVLVDDAETKVLCVAAEELPESPPQSVIELFP